MRRARDQRFDFFLAEMLSAMKRVQSYTLGIHNYDDFTRDSLVRDAVIRNFEVMGESVKHVPFSFQKKNNKIPWTHMLALRNFIVHEFFDVDDEILWEIIKTDLATNINDLTDILARYHIPH